MDKGTIFFDYDGTLHNSMKVYGPAFRLGYSWLVEQGYAEPRNFDDEWISQWLGWTTQDMWAAFMPELPDDIWPQAAAIVGAEMDRLSEAGASELFKGVPETLSVLKADGWTLAVLSNCRCAYRDAHRRFHGLDRWFDRYIVAGDHPGLAKWEMYAQHSEDPSLPRPHVMVGDRFHDIDVAVRGGIPAVGCGFGFGRAGELDAAAVIIDSFDQLPAALEEVLG